jgi:hypothetical protein
VAGLRSADRAAAAGGSGGGEGAASAPPLGRGARDLALLIIGDSNDRRLI